MTNNVNNIEIEERIRTINYRVELIDRDVKRKEILTDSIVSMGGDPITIYNHIQELMDERENLIRERTELVNAS